MARRTKNPSAYELREEIAAAQEALEREPARKLIKYVKRAGAYKGEVTDFTPKQYREITGKYPRRSILHQKTRKVPWEWALER